MENLFLEKLLRFLIASGISFYLITIIIDSTGYIGGMGYSPNYQVLSVGQGVLPYILVLFILFIAVKIYTFFNKKSK